MTKNQFRLQLATIAGFIRFLVGLFLSIFSAQAQPGRVDTSFVFQGAGVVSRIAVQPDDRIVFVSSSASRFFFGRALENGDIDPSFDSGSGADNRIDCIAVHSDGRILAGGSFTNFNGATRSRLVRLLPDGNSDDSFAASTDGRVTDTLFLEDGRSIIAGSFTNVNGVVRSRIARLLPDGSLDALFQPNVPADCWLNALALQPDGEVVAAGGISSGSLSALYLVRVATNGQVSMSHAIGPWLSYPVPEVLSLAIQRDGRLLIGGNFTNVYGRAAWNLARLKADGSLDESFNPAVGANQRVTAIELQGDDTIYLSGAFTSYAGVVRHGLTRLSRDGMLDINYFPEDSAVFSGGGIALQSAGRLLASGVWSTNQTGILRLNGYPDTPPVLLQSPTNVSVNAGTNAVFGVQVSSVRPLKYHWFHDGNTIAGVDSPFLALNKVAPSDAGAYWTVVSNSHGAVTSQVATLSVTAVAPVFVVQPTDLSVAAGQGYYFSVIATGIPLPKLQWYLNGTAIPGAIYDNHGRYPTTEAHAGEYTVVASNIAGVVTSEVATLTVTFAPPEIVSSPADLTVAEGRLATFEVNASGAPPPNYQWYHDGVPIAGEVGSRLVLTRVGSNDIGEYQAVAINSQGSATSAVARLMMTNAPAGPGSVDSSYSLAANGKILCMAQDASEGLIVAGDFDHIGGIPRKRVARILENGTVDATFESGLGPGSVVSSMALSPDGSIVLGGRFWAPENLSEVEVVRLRPDGSIDAQFAPLELFYPSPFIGESLQFPSVAVQSLGHLVVGTGPGFLSELVRTYPNGDPYAELSISPSPGSTSTFTAGYGLVCALRSDKLLVDYLGRTQRRITPGLSADWSFTNSVRNAAFGRVTAFLELPDESVLIGGGFYFGTGGGDGGLLRMLPTGEFDSSFSPVQSTFGRVYSIARQDDGKIVIGGSFTNLGGVTRRGVARLDPDGGLDLSFDPGVGMHGSEVRSVTVLKDGRIAVAGSFSAFDNVACSNLVVLRGDPPGPPLLSEQPESRTVVDGRSAALHVSAGPIPVTFQWRRNGAAIPGATNHLIEFIHADASMHSGEYTVVVSNSSGSVTSAPATLSVAAAPADVGRPVVRSLVDGAGSDGLIRDFARQPDGKLIIIGNFREVAGRFRNGIARLLPDGQCDESFDAGVGADGNLMDVLILPDGRVVASGSFRSVDGFARTNLVRFNADGSVDSTFDAGIAAESWLISGIASGPGGKVVVFGQFSQFAGVRRNGIAGLNEDGSVDTSILPPFLGISLSVQGVEPAQDGSFLVATSAGVRKLFSNGKWDYDFSTASGTWNVRSVLPRPNGRMVVAGGFALSNQVRYVARLTESGAIDSTFTSSTLQVGSAVHTLTADECGRLVITGVLRPANSTLVHAVMRLLPDGTIDPSFQNLSIDSEVLRALPIGDRIVISGYFSEVDGVRSRGLAVLRGGGTVPEFLSVPLRYQTAAGGSAIFYVTFSQCNEPFVQWFRDGVAVPGATNLVFVISNATPSLAGSYSVTASNTSGVVTSPAAPLVVTRAPLKPGSLDIGFYSGAGPDNSVTALDVDGDGRVVIAGDFLSVDGVPRPGIARLGPDGSVDRSFNPGSGFTNTITSVTKFSSVIAREDGKVIVGGFFTRVGAESRYGLAQLNADGSVDEAFVPDFPEYGREVTAVIRQPDGRLMVGTTGGAHRLHADGANDPTFEREGSQGNVMCLARYPDGRVLLGGSFSSGNGTGSLRLIRVNSDGKRDLTFNQFFGTDSPVLSVQIDDHERIVIGGGFSTVNGSPARRIARLRPDGSIDGSFELQSGANFEILALAVQDDGKTYLAGSFTNFNAVYRGRIARLLDDGSLDDSFDPGLGADSVVYALKLDAFGMLHLGGRFSTYNALRRPAVVRVIGEPRLANVAVNDQRIRAQFLSFDGWAHHMEGSAETLGAPWNSLTNQTGRGYRQWFDVPLEPRPFRFYRMRVE